MELQKLPLGSFILKNHQTDRSMPTMYIVLIHQSSQSEAKDTCVATNVEEMVALARELVTAILNGMSLSLSSLLCRGMKVGNLVCRGMKVGKKERLLYRSLILQFSQEAQPCRILLLYSIPFFLKHFVSFTFP